MKIIVNIFLVLIMGWATLSQTIATTVDYYIVNGKDVVCQTDKNGNAIKEKYQYSAYGEERNLKNGSLLTSKFSQFTVSSNPFKYSSYYRDSESSMDYLQARYYSPKLMRFISRDTYDLENRYAYGNSDPINSIDPNGHMPRGINIALSFLGLIAGGIMTCVTVGSGTAGGLAIAGAISSFLSGGAQVGSELALNDKLKSILSNTSFGLGVVGIVFDIASIRSAFYEHYRQISSPLLSKDSEIEIALENLKGKTFVCRKNEHFYIEYVDNVENNKLITHRYDLSNHDADYFDNEKYLNSSEKYFNICNDTDIEYCKEVLLNPNNEFKSFYVSAYLSRKDKDFYHSVTVINNFDITRYLKNKQLLNKEFSLPQLEDAFTNAANSYSARGKYNCLNNSCKHFVKDMLFYLK